jgi:hypothetical protein
MQARRIRLHLWPLTAQAPAASPSLACCSRVMLLLRVARVVRGIDVLDDPRPHESPGLLRSCWCGIGLPMQRIKAAVALMLALVWLPAVSCCLLDTSGLVSKQDCCSKKHAQSVPGRGSCDKPCGTLASAHYFPQLSQPLLIMPVDVPVFDRTDILPEIQSVVGIGRDLPATAPPELAGHWQFSFRAALSPRAPSFAS